MLNKYMLRGEKITQLFATPSVGSDILTEFQNKRFHFDQNWIPNIAQPALTLPMCISA